MIAQLLNREFLMSQLPAVNALVDGMARDLYGGSSAASALADAAGVTAEDLETSRQALAELQARGLPRDGLPTVCIARDPVTSILQSALEAFFVKADAVEAPAQQLGPADIAVTDVSLRAPWTTQGQSLFAQFDRSDARWALGFLAARGLSGLRRKRAFASDPARLTIANKARLLVVGDWGSGIPRARQVSEHMRARLTDSEARSRECHVIHLGDVYYSGFEHEYRNRFLAYWPVRPEEAATYGSWCLNGNHDMFSGGHGYFGYMLQDARFARHRGASYFCLENDRWQFIGLDSAYDLHGLRGDEGDLYGPQAAWVATLRTSNPSKRAVLFSHHQLFSAYEPGSPKMEAKLQPVLGGAPATAWFWGHEHACVAYKPHPFVKHARLVGHGGVPVKPLGGQAPDSVEYEFRDAVVSGLNRFGRFGFAIIDVDEDALTVSYVSELGAVHRTETLK